MTIFINLGKFLGIMNCIYTLYVEMTLFQQLLKKTKFTMKNIWKIGLWLPLYLLLLACQEDDLLQEEPPRQDDDNQPQVLQREDSLKLAVSEIMDEWYLWNQELPEVDWQNYASAEDLLDALIYKELDKWSYMQPEEEYDAYYQRGEYQGYGVRFAFDMDRNLRVAFAYEDSPFGRAGVERAWIINKIDGQLVSNLVNSSQLSNALGGNSHTFEFIKPDGSVVTESMTKSTITINPVQDADVLQLENATVGYLMFNNFLSTAEEDLEKAFQKFQAAGVNELVVDLRYNGGGLVSIAEWIASNIIGNAGAGRNFLEYQFNDNKAEELNEVVPFKNSSIPLNLDRVVFITSSGSASASELLINGLRPFIDVVLVGDDTYGKPVGSFPIKVFGYAISPISFKIVNDNGEGEYFNGLPADVYVEDDVTRTLGNPDEARLKEALFYIEHGTFSGISVRSHERIKEQQIELQGFRQEIGAF